MKKCLSLALACLLILFLSPAALANGYGLRGGIYDIVSDDPVYDGYFASADDGSTRDAAGRYVNHAILNSRYHSVLIAAERVEGRWQARTVSTAAVYQPDDERGRAVELTHTGDGFRLQYGQEVYTFTWQPEQNAYILTLVRYNEDCDYGTSLMYSSGQDGQPRGYLLWQGGPENAIQPIGDALWNAEPITLEEFNITLLPRTMQDVRQMNMVRGRLHLSGGDVLGDSEAWTAADRGMKLPVYAAPDESAFRAAKGKASVSTGGEMTLLGEYGEWTLVAYEVSSRTSRIGFVHANLMENPFPLPISEVTHDLFAIRDTCLTDDPDVSQYAQCLIPAGTRLTGLASWGNYYAYVAYEADGVPCWGFVPLRDLRAPAAEQDLVLGDTAYDPAITYRWDLADLMIGKWDAVDSSVADPAEMPRLILGSGGFYDCLGDGMNETYFGYTGIWRIRDTEENAPFDGQARCTLIFEDETNCERPWGLILEADPSRFTLVNTEGEYVVYERAEYSTYGNG